MAVIRSYSNNRITMTAANDELTGSFTVSFFRYIEATTAGHKAIITDTAGNTVFESEANGANYTDLIPVTGNKPFNGLKLTTLGSGKVEIYLR